jgi:hypothetical protein
VIVGFSEKLYAAGFRQRVESTENFRGKRTQLLQQYTRQAVCYPEPAFIPSDYIEEQSIGGKITLVCDFPANGRVLVLVEVMVIFVEYSVVPQPQGLMHLKVETHRSHKSLSLRPISCQTATSASS